MSSNPDTKYSQPVYLLFTPQSVTLDAANSIINQVKALVDEVTIDISILISSPVS